MKKVIAFLFFLLIAARCNAAPYRIVSLAPNTTEILFALGLGDSIVGVDGYSDYPEAARAIEKVGTFDRPNMERIVMLAPDHVLLSSIADKDMIEYLEGLGMGIIEVSPDSVDELCSDIEMIGAVFGKESRASELVNDIKAAISSASRQTKPDRPRVFVQLFDDPLVTVSSYISDIIYLAGGKNIAWDIKDDAALFSYESLVQRDPEIVIIIGFSESSNLPESISAVRNNRIYRDIDPDVLLRPGPRTAGAIKQLNRIFYEKD